MGIEYRCNPVFKARLEFHHNLSLCALLISMHQKFSCLQTDVGNTVIFNVTSPELERNCDIHLMFKDYSLFPRCDGRI